MREAFSQKEHMRVKVSVFRYRWSWTEHAKRKSAERLTKRARQVETRMNYDKVDQYC